MLKELVCRLVDNLIFTIKCWVHILNLGTIAENVEAAKIKGTPVDSHIFFPFNMQILQHKESKWIRDKNIQMTLMLTKKTIKTGMKQEQEEIL